MNNSDISIVTAFFDIGRGDINESDGFPSYLKRTTDTYFEYFSYLASLDNEMIIFTEKEHENRILSLRKGKPTKVVILDLNRKFKKLIDIIENVQNNEEFIKKVNPEQIKNIEYWNPRYVLINNLKSYFVNYAIKRKFVSSNLVSWLDFGYIRSSDVLNSVTEWNYPFDNARINFFKIDDSIELNSVDDVYNIIFNNVPYIIGGCVVGGIDIWGKVYKLLRKELISLLNSNICDDDQGVYAKFIFENKSIVNINSLGQDNWFV